MRKRNKIVSSTVTNIEDTITGKAVKTDRIVGKIETKGELIRRKVHRFCKIAMWRTVEAVILFLIVSIICVVTGSGIIPFFAYQISGSMGLTQSTNIYIAFASWILPMLFYVLLVTAFVFVALRKIIKALHSYMTKIINK